MEDQKTKIKTKIRTENPEPWSTRSPLFPEPPAFPVPMLTLMIHDSVTPPLHYSNSSITPPLQF